MAWESLKNGLFKGAEDKMAEFVETIQAEKRWPDHVEQEYGKRRPDAVAEKSGRKIHYL